MNTKWTTTFVGLAAGAALFGATVRPARWIGGSELNNVPAGSCVVLLGDGSVMVTGGDSGSGSLAGAAIYSPSGEVTQAAPMSVARTSHACAVVNGKQVLVA